MKIYKHGLLGREFRSLYMDVLRQAGVMEIAVVGVSMDKMNLSKENEALIKEMLERSTWQMIKEPVQQLKALKEVEDIDHYKVMIENLFDFGSDDD